MSNKTKALMFITIIVLSLSVASISYIMMEPCEFCGRKFCFGTCSVDNNTSGENNTLKSKKDKKKTNQTGVRLTSTSKASQSYLDKIVFVGDSRTVALIQHADIDPEKVFADTGLTHEKAMTKQVVKIQKYKNISIPEAVKVTAPDIMIVNFGINGIAWMSVDNFIEGYEKLIDTLIENSPTSTIVIQAIMPVSLQYEQISDGVSNEKIDEANDAIFKMCERKGLYYLGVDEILKDENNDLISEYSSDGLHYNKKAYDVIIDYILTHAIYKKK